MTSVVDLGKEKKFPITQELYERLESVIHDYDGEMDPSNEQRRISLLPVYDPATCVFFDQDSKQYDRSDAMWAMEMFSMTPKVIDEMQREAARLVRRATNTKVTFVRD